MTKVAVKKGFRLKLLLALLLLVSSILAFQVLFLNKIYPGIYISGVAVSGLTAKQADKQIVDTLSSRLSSALEFFHGKEAYSIQISEKTTRLDAYETIVQALDFGRRKIYFKPVHLRTAIYFTKDMDSQIGKIAAAVDQPAINSEIRLLNSEVNVTPSQPGKVLDVDLLKNYLSEYIHTGSLKDNNLPFKTTHPKLSYEDALGIKKTLDGIKLNPIVLNYEDKKWEVNLELIMDMIIIQDQKIKPNLISTDLLKQPVKTSLQKQSAASILALDNDKLEKFIEGIALETDRPVEEPLFNFDPSGNGGQGKITEFKLPIEGKKLSASKVVFLISQAMVSEESRNIELPVETIQPKNKLTNDLGIKELIGRGKSNFSGSIENRIYNIGLAASKINGVLVAPGEIFSFNQTVGDISAASGYKQAYIIKSGRTVLDDGGGVCQVSTTLFRTVLNAGLPVIARTAHAYRVGYYEQGFPPGLDATIFHPSVDFQFKNDTSHHILIQTYIQGKSLYIDFYGSSDGKVVSLTKSVITNETPPPPELRQDDPTLPRGTVKQVDFPAWGAKVVFSRVVTRNGETLIQETYRSNYRPWQAVFLVGTQ